MFGPYEITVSGSLLSKSTITDEHAAMLPSHFDDMHIAESATVSKEGDLARIDFSYEGMKTQYMNSGSSSYSERIAYIAQVGQEIDLGLEGSILVVQKLAPQQFPVGNAQRIDVANGVVHITLGTVYSDGNILWRDETTKVDVDMRSLLGY
jgi:hypothetical protein